MRRASLLIPLVLLALAGCGSSSTLPVDDQEFCSEQEDELASALDAANEVVDGDRHWSSDGEPFALRQVQVEPAANFIRAFNAQDADLKEHVDDVSSALFDLELDLNVEPEDAFADDAASSREVVRSIESLQEFCDENG